MWVVIAVLVAVMLYAVKNRAGRTKDETGYEKTLA